MGKDKPPPCDACGGQGVIYIRDPDTGRTWVDTCSTCGGKGTR